MHGLRASDAERDEVAGRLRDEFVAGRLSHETFLHRMNAAFTAKRRGELPALVADLPASTARPSAAGALADWVRGAWRRLSPPGQARAARAAVAQARVLTTGMGAVGGGRPVALRFPRGSGDRFSIGRDANCDLAIADMSVSRWHATLERTPDGWALTDLESTNGTRLNGWRVRGTVKVIAGDLVSFGNAEVVFARSEGTGELTA